MGLLRAPTSWPNLGCELLCELFLLFFFGGGGRGTELRSTHTRRCRYPASREIGIGSWMDLVAQLELPTGHTAPPQGPSRLEQPAGMVAKGARISRSVGFDGDGMSQTFDRQLVGSPG